jgi:hypothetical protein
MISPYSTNKPSSIKISSHGVTYSVEWPTSETTTDELVKAALALIQASDHHINNINDYLREHLEQFEEEKED